MNVSVRLPPKKRVCGTTEAAKLYGCSPQHMWLMAQKGQVWSEQVGPKSVLFDADEIERLAKDRDALRKAGKLGGRRPGGSRKTA
jgi:hypothetical protein